MKAKMLKPKFLIGGLVIFLLIVLLNKDYLITEHLANPSLFSLDKELTDTNTKLDKLTSEFNTMKSQASAQAGQAASARASLQAIKTS